MGSICLSSASILLCAPFSRLESMLVVIPPALEFIFSTCLLFIKWNGGKRHLLLTAEGWIYLTLSGLELLSDVLPAVRDNLSLFRGFYLGIGVASSIPILFYTFFLFLFTNGELLETLPNRIKNVAKLTLILFIPAIIIFNEVASFVGVAIRNISPPSENITQSQIAIGFTSNRGEAFWTFFTSLTLALLTVFQAAIFCLTFSRLVRAVLHQRHIEKRGSNTTTHFINGTGWLCAAAKLGIVETVVGFAGGGFGIALTRRIMRMLSRACLCIGIVKGVDTIEDFRSLTRELARNRPSNNNLRQLISNPRFSTFRQLSPTATEFHATPRAPTKSNSHAYKENAEEKAPATTGTKRDKNVLKRKTPHYLTTTQRQSIMTTQSGLPGMNHFASVKEQLSKQRVTVHYEDGAPRLHMRFSSIDLPNPALIMGKGAKTPSQSEWSETNSKRTAPSVIFQYDDEENDAELAPPVPQFQKANNTDFSLFRDSLNLTPISSNTAYEIVDARKLSQTTAKAHIYYSTALVNSTTSPQLGLPLSRSAALPPKSDTDSSRFKSVTSLKSMPDSIQAMRDLTMQFPGPPEVSRVRFSHRGPEIASWDQESSNRWNAQYTPAGAAPQVLGTPVVNISRQSRFAPLTPTPTPPRNLSNERLPQVTKRVDTSATIMPTSSSSSPSTARTIRAHPVASVEQQPTTRDNIMSWQNLHDWGKSIDNVAMPWPKNTDLSRSAQQVGLAPSASSSKTPTNPRLNVGKAPWRARPEPVHMGHWMESLYVEPMVIPPRTGYESEAVEDEYYGGLEPRMAGAVLGDSEVLRMEDSSSVWMA